jgi:hypothetical protein
MFIGKDKQQHGNGYAVASGGHRDHIAQALQGFGLVYLTDPAGDFHVGWKKDEQVGGALKAYIGIEHDDVLRVSVSCDRTISEGWEAVMFCNGWNRRTLWPKAYVLLPDTEAQTESCQIELEASFPLADQDCQEKIASMVGLALATTGQFWREAIEHGL